MLNRITFALAVALMALAGIAVASATDDPPSRPVPIDPADRVGTPNANGTEIAARARDKHGREVGVVVYRNTRNRLCIAEGHVQNGKVGVFHGSRFKELPLEHGGNCGVDPKPISFHFVRAADDPSTPGDQAHTSFYGVADASVAELTVVGPDGQRDVRPQQRGAFITIFDRQINEAVRVVVRRRDGSIQPIEIPPQPDVAAMEEEARKYAPQPGQPPHQFHPED